MELKINELLKYIPDIEEEKEKMQKYKEMLEDTIQRLEQI